MPKAYRRRRRLWEYDDYMDRYYNYGEYEDYVDYKRKMPGTSSIFVSPKKMAGYRGHRARLNGRRSRSVGRRPPTPQNSRSRSRGRSRSASRRSGVRTAVESARSMSVDGSSYYGGSVASSRASSRRGGVAVASSAASSSRSGNIVMATKNPGNKLNQKLKYGVSVTDERGSETSDSFTVYFGHTTFPVTLMLQTLARVMAKKVLNTMGIFYEQESDTIRNLGPDECITVKFTYLVRQDTTNTYDEENFVYGDPGVDAAWWSSITKLQSDIYTWLEKTSTAGSNATLAWFEIIVNEEAHMSYKKVLLRGAKLYFKVDSSLKYQNRTVENTTDDDIDDVNNVPLTGRIYTGPGNGMEVVGGTQQSRPFIGDLAYGLIYVPSTGTYHTLKDPVLPQLTRMAKKFGNLNIDAGQMETNKLHTEKTMYLNSFLRLIGRRFAIIGPGAPDTVLEEDFPFFRTVGEYAIIALEKKVEIYQSGTSTPTSSVKVAWERNLNIVMALEPGKEQNKQVNVFTAGRYQTST